MDNNGKLISCLVVCVICVLLVLSCGVISLTQNGDYSIGDFAVDSDGRVYIYYDMKQTIYVYQNGQFLYDYGEMNDMTLRSKRGVRFAITENDELWLLESNSFYAMDLEGNLIRESSYADAYDDSRFIEYHNRVYEDAQENVYTMKGKFLGWTRVIKNDVDVVFQISGVAFFCKIGTLLGVLAAILPTAVMIRIYWREGCHFGC